MTAVGTVLGAGHRVLRRGHRQAVRVRLASVDAAASGRGLRAFDELEAIALSEQTSSEKSLVLECTLRTTAFDVTRLE